MEPTSHSSNPDNKKRTISRKVFLIVLFGLVILGLVLVGWYNIGGSASIVPKKIRKSVNFSVYYPASMPSGYMLDTNSFRLAEAGVVLFSVTNSNSKDIVFSEQQQPSNTEIDKFISSYLPLNSTVQLPLGMARVGAYGSAPNIRTVLSLPIYNGPWLIVTAPSEINQADLVKITDSLKK